MTTVLAHLPARSFAADVGRPISAVLYSPRAIGTGSELMRPFDFECFKATIDELHREGSTTLAAETWYQPSAVYCSADRMRDEQQRIFDRLPLVVACSSEL